MGNMKIYRDQTLIIFYYNCHFYIVLNPTFQTEISTRSNMIFYIMNIEHCSRLSFLFYHKTEKFGTTMTGISSFYLSLLRKDSFKKVVNEQLNLIFISDDR